MAIGLGKIFGFEFMENFNYPYISKSITEFWRRWHISLNKWFIDYVYIPLGGSRVSKPKVICNILIVFALSGLWHGANWTFIVWGLYNGILITIFSAFNLNKKRSGIISEQRFLPTLKESSQIVITFLLVLFGWIIFRADSITQAWSYLCGLFNMSLFYMPNFSSLGMSFIEISYTIFFIVLLQLIDWIQRKQDFGLEISNIKSLGLFPNL